MKVSEYLQLSREERTKHVNLSTSCEVDFQVTTGAKRKRGKKALLKSLGLEDDVVDWRKGKVNLCHLCESHSKNGYCTNLQHLYLGTAQENYLDKPERVRKAVSSWRRSNGGKAVTKLRFVSLFDGFVGAPARVSQHNRAVGADPESRVRLEGELLSLLDSLEEFTYTLNTKRGERYDKSGKRVPLKALEELRKQTG